MYIYIYLLCTHACYTIHYTIQYKDLNDLAVNELKLHLLPCLHEDKWSNRLFIDLLLSLKMYKKSFSSKQKLDDFVTKSIHLSFGFQMFKKVL